MDMMNNNYRAGINLLHMAGKCRETLATVQIKLLRIDTLQKLQNHVQKFIRLVCMDPVPSTGNVSNGGIREKPKNVRILRCPVDNTQHR